MTAKLTCDICKKDVKSLEKFGTITPSYQIPGRIEHVCSGCSRILDQKLTTLREHYAKLLADDVREWLLEFEKKKQPSTDVAS